MKTASIAGAFIAALGYAASSPLAAPHQTCLPASTMAVHQSASFREISRQWDGEPLQRVLGYLGGRDSPTDGGYELKFPSRRDPSAFDATLDISAALVPDSSSSYQNYAVTFTVRGRDNTQLHQSGVGFVVRREESGSLDFIGLSRGSLNMSIPPSCAYVQGGRKK